MRLGGGRPDDRGIPEPTTGPVEVAPRTNETADLTPAQAARLEAIEAAPYAEEALQERVATALSDIDDRGNPLGLTWEACSFHEQNHYRRLAVAAIDVMRGAADDGARGRDCICGETKGAHYPDCPANTPYMAEVQRREAMENARAAVGAPATAEGDGA